MSSHTSHAHLSAYLVLFSLIVTVAHFDWCKVQISNKTTKLTFHFINLDSIARQLIGLHLKLNVFRIITIIKSVSINLKFVSIASNHGHVNNIYNFLFQRSLYLVIILQPLNYVHISNVWMTQVPITTSKWHN